MFITECDFYSLSGPRAQQRGGSMSLYPLGTTTAVCDILYTPDKKVMRCWVLPPD